MRYFNLISSNFNVTGLRNQIESNPDLWGKFTLRQATPGSPHADTETIVLRGPINNTIEAMFDDFDLHNNKENLKVLTEMKELISQFFAVTDANQDMGLGRVMLVKLKPGGHIKMHYDGGKYADAFERFHLVVSSAVGNLFHCGPMTDNDFETVHMRPGELWTFHHKHYHELWNYSDQDRIHLIIDAMSRQYRTARPAYAG